MIRFISPTTGRPKVPAEVREAAMALTPKAIETLGEIMQDPKVSPGVRVTAAATSPASGRGGRPRRRGRSSAETRGAGARRPGLRPPRSPAVPRPGFGCTTYGWRCGSWCERSRASGRAGPQTLAMTSRYVARQEDSVRELSERVAQTMGGAGIVCFCLWKAAPGNERTASPTCGMNRRHLVSHQVACVMQP